MPINSKNKGKRYELEVASDCRAHGYAEARRTAQYCGKTGEASDVIGLDGIHIECKFTERTDMYGWIEQAERDSVSNGELPVVFHRKCNKKTLVIMREEDWFAMYEAYRAKLTEVSVNGTYINADSE